MFGLKQSSPHQDINSNAVHKHQLSAKENRNLQARVISDFVAYSCASS